MNGHSHNLGIANYYTMTECAWTNLILKCVCKEE